MVVYCLKDAQDEVIRRAQVADPSAEPVICGLLTGQSFNRAIPEVT
uniref:Uncharacterized protein n=1 Tax=uncultured Nocardioidaceae bacterium TaxID=253824 RepID=A0A6J4MGH0_9ACTN|nr:MAG: hypothetical protein AVDCRST_MAG46-3006 [uncultured Nocardioidaceae bacterium]